MVRSCSIIVLAILLGFIGALAGGPLYLLLETNESPGVSDVAGSEWRRGSGGFGYESYVLGWESTQRLRNEPIVLQPVLQSKVALPSEGVRQILGRVVPLDAGMTAPLCLHVINTHGLGGRLDHDTFPSTESILDLFTDDLRGADYFGHPTFTKTRYGLRPSVYRGFGKAVEGHNDQTIACFSQLGLPLTYELLVNEKPHSLRDVLADSLACFDLRQKEMEWAALAYSSYLPPFSRWKNKFDDEFSFDMLVAELLDRDLGAGSCCGCHIAEAMIAILRIHQEHSPLLSETMQIELGDRVDELVATAVDTQFSDGSWDARWYEASRVDSPKVIAPVAERMLATGHVLHFLMFAPDQELLTPVVFDRASQWLYTHLIEADHRFIERHFCPYSHGAWVLRILTSPKAETPYAGLGEL